MLVGIDIFGHCHFRYSKLHIIYAQLPFLISWPNNCYYSRKDSYQIQSVVIQYLLTLSLTLSFFHSCLDNFSTLQSDRTSEYLISRLAQSLRNSTNIERIAFTYKRIRSTMISPSYGKIDEAESLVSRDK